ncbi:MAG TPA: response regulator [Candidatus Thermoplasmatota archaeon]|nr:response regulator [Candidatus Thermoplasmatota archaeon]
MALVYVADDEPELAELLAETLTDAGHEVQTASDGASLLAKVQGKTPDLILLDINMPGLSGWDVRRKLIEAKVPTPVIAVTAQGGQSTEVSALSTLQFAGFVRKPFRLAEVLDAVDGALKFQFRL